MDLRIKKIIFMLLVFTTLAAGTLSAQSNAGEVHIYVFSETGMPMTGVETTVEGRTVSSDESGLIEFLHSPGTHEFTLFYENQPVTKVSVPVRQNQVTEIIVTAAEQEQDAVTEVETADSLQEGEELEQLDESLPTGSMYGSITHIETGEPVVNATVIFRGVDFETTTDESGNFTAEVPEGIYSVSVIHPDFSTQTMDDLEVIVGEKTEFAMELTPSAIELDTIPVFAATEVRVQGGIANLIEETKNSGVVLNLIGVQQFSRSGDSDAASALSRVTGLTVVGGRYVYVRGMGERYSSSYLNGSLLPSPEVDKRVVPLDLFPISVIESMAVQKSYSPDMIGDFGGGAVKLRTTGIPDDRYKRRLRATIKASITYDLFDTFTTQILETAAPLDLLGIDIGNRKMPESFPDEKIVEGVFSGLTKEDLEQLGESLPNTWEPAPTFLFPDFSLSGSIRDKIEIDEKSNFALSLSLMYKHGFDTGQREKKKLVVGTEPGTYLETSSYNSTETSRNVDIGALIDFGLDIGDNFGIESTSLLTRLSESGTERYEGYFSDNSRDVRHTTQEWTEKMLFSQKLGGFIGFSGLNNAELDWQYTFSIAKRYSPDTRITLYWKEEEETTYYLSTRAEGSKRLWNDVTDFVHDGMFQFKLPVFFNSASADFLDIGANVLYRSRATNTRTFQMDFEAGDFTQEQLEASPENLFTPANIGPNGFELQEDTASTANYTADQFLVAGFVGADILLFGNLRFNPGLRVEYSRQTVNTYDLYTGRPTPAAELASLPVDLLPAVNFTLPLGSKMQIRLGGSKTVNRPDFRELSEQPKDLLLGSGQLVGNPNLKAADIYNVDLRWEAYLTEEENISLGGFFKYFQNAIEMKHIASAQNQILPDNVPVAFNLGGELEWQLTFRFFSDAIRNSMMNMKRTGTFEEELAKRKSLGGLASFFRDLHTSGNVSVIWSQIDYQGNKGTNTSAVRPLQGQSPFVINVSLGYKNSVSWSQERPVKTSIFLSYNVFGARISKIGTYDLEDYYEQPFHQLDLVMKQRFSEIFSISLKAKNLLDLPVIETIGPNVTDNNIIHQYRKGRSFTLGVSFDL